MNLATELAIVSMFKVFRFPLPQFCFFLFLFFASQTDAQNLFHTARTDGFGSPSLLFGISVVKLDPEAGEDFTFLTARASVGIGRKTDIFGSLDGVLSDDIFNTRFIAWSAGLKHQFIRTGLVDIGAIARLRGNRTDENRFEDALLDFAGIISVQATAFHPYFALVYSRPFGFNLRDDFQRSSVIGVEVPIGDIPRIFGEISLGDRRSFGGAFKLAF